MSVEQSLPKPALTTSSAQVTHIDRRKCKRTVPMRVLGLGLARTGTASLRKALIELGYGDCYHFDTLTRENPSDQEIWVEALEGKYEGGREFTKADWDGLLGHCQSVTDTPCTVFWEELLEAYPGSKVVLTIRDSAEQWIASQNATIVAFMDKYIEGVEGDIMDPFVKMNKLILDHYPMARALHGGEEEAKAWYEGWIAEVKARIPADDLLIFNVKQGWGPLCEFLGVEIPDRPFPRTNDRGIFNKNVDAMMKKRGLEKSGGRVEMIQAAA